MAIAVVVTLVATIVQGTIGIGLGMLSVPVLTLVHPDLAPVPQLIITLPLTLMMLRQERRDLDWAAVTRVVIARIPGIGAGIVLLSTFGERLLDGLTGLIVLAAVALIASGVTVHRNRASEVVAGVISGATGTISSIGGPPLALLYRNDTGPTVRSNLAAIFFVGLLMMLAARAASGHVARTDLEVALWLLPAVAVGWLVSRKLKSRVDGRLLRVGILAISAVAGLGLVVTTLAG